LRLEDFSGNALILVITAKVVDPVNFFP